jgi:hypothetical protein
MTSMRFGKEFTRRRPIERRNIIRTRQEDDEIVLVNLDDHALPILGFDRRQCLFLHRLLQLGTLA